MNRLEKWKILVVYVKYFREFEINFFLFIFAFIQLKLEILAQL